MKLKLAGHKYQHILDFLNDGLDVYPLNKMGDIEIAFVPGYEVIADPRNPEKCGFACYTADGERSYVMCGGDVPEGVDDAEEYFLTNIARELAHHLQRVNNKPYSEKWAESYARSMWELWKAREQE